MLCWEYRGELIRLLLIPNFLKTAIFEGEAGNKSSYHIMWSISRGK